jgi:hypothetical protein
VLCVVDKDVENVDETDVVADEDTLDVIDDESVVVAVVVTDVVPVDT